MHNPQWLASFAVLAEAGTFTRTAEQLDITQAAVSQHIRRLEQDLGQLVIRHPRQIELTPAGLALLEYINEIAQADKRLQHRLKGENNRTGEVSLISPGSVGLTLYPILLDLQQRNRGLTIRHRFAPDSEVLEAVKQNHYELGIVTLKPDDSRLTASRFSEEPLELIVPANHSVSGWEDLEQLGFIDHPDGQVMADRLLSRRYPEKPGIHAIPRRGFINQISLILEPVARGLGFTVLPRYARQAFSRQSDIEVIEGAPEIKEILWLIHRAEWPLSAHAAWVAEQLREAVAALEQL
ncbi:LysR family transcriptional regulator [Marinobacterium lutimaris]|uniref:Transcriptional regulator, LysR family n=1 Tax=Marinobacterium lutimaris TaxID=568106 RepID=A0A1H5TMR6_9GAMM|nr:LysR family transcriptional regulator [Marinobacterium lutimaris]SEF64059.1 transcriptional regulator, LysR family [Marinobacterium lutimaris]